MSEVRKLLRFTEGELAPFWFWLLGLINGILFYWGIVTVIAACNEPGSGCFSR